jgi:hypothetical protein
MPQMGHSLHFGSVSISGLPPTTTEWRTSENGRTVQILLQKSKVAGLRICRENTKQEAIADSCSFSRVAEVTCEFGVRE